MHGPEDIAVLIPIAGIIAGIIAMLLNHQRRMAELLHGSHAAQTQQTEVSALRYEVNQLRDQVNRLTVALDKSSSPAPVQAEVRQRIAD